MPLTQEQFAKKFGEKILDHVEAALGGWHTTVTEAVLQRIDYETGQPSTEIPPIALRGKEAGHKLLDSRINEAAAGREVKRNL